MKIVLLSIAALLMTLTSTASAQMAPEQAEFAVETRQAVLHLMRWNISPLAGMARGRVDYDAEVAEKSAARLVELTQMLSDAFEPDTRGTDIPNEALDVIWEQPEDFADKIQASIEASQALLAVAGDESALRQAVGNLGSSCGSCHDNYRVDD